MQSYFKSLKQADRQKRAKHAQELFSYQALSKEEESELQFPQQHRVGYERRIRGRRTREQSEVSDGDQLNADAQFEILRITGHRICPIDQTVWFNVLARLRYEGD